VGIDKLGGTEASPNVFGRHTTKPDEKCKEFCIGFEEIFRQFLEEKGINGRPDVGGDEVLRFNQLRHA
jgi:hypothetical protein